MLSTKFMPLRSFCRDRCLTRIHPCFFLQMGDDIQSHRGLGIGNITSFGNGLDDYYDGNFGLRKPLMDYGAKLNQPREDAEGIPSRNVDTIPELPVILYRSSLTNTKPATFPASHEVTGSNGRDCLSKPSPTQTAMWSSFSCP